MRIVGVLGSPLWSPSDDVGDVSASSFGDGLIKSVPTGNGKRIFLAYVPQTNVGNLVRPRYVKSCVAHAYQSCIGKRECKTNEKEEAYWSISKMLEEVTQKGTGASLPRQLLWVHFWCLRAY